MFQSYFYSPLKDTFTRVDEKRETSSLLNNIYTNVTHTQVTLKVDSLKLTSRISDHYSIFCISDIGIEMKTSFMKKRNFNNKNKSIYEKNLYIKVNWDKYFSTNFET